MSGSKPYRPKFGYDIRIKPDVAPQPAKKTQTCGIGGCTEQAEWRVPRSRENMDERIWLCRGHLRAHNERWNFFSGMSEEEIRRFGIEAGVGHRPTWPLGRRGANAKSPKGQQYWNHGYEDGFAVFEEAAEPARPAHKTQFTKGQLDALAVLDLEETANLNQIKARYKELVKRFHPDANGGDRGTEERLKQVIRAYGHLRATGFARTRS